MDEAGKLQLRKDVYGRDAKMMPLLKNTGSRDLENIVAHANPSYKPAERLVVALQRCLQRQFRSFVL